MREIWIHPTLAYGAHTLLEKAIYLKAIVTLHEIEKLSDDPYPEISYLDLSFVATEEFQKAKKYIEENYFEDECHQWANKIAEHLKKSKDIEVNDVYKHLQALSKDQIAFEPLSEEEERAMNRFHWNIYFSTEEET